MGLHRHLDARAPHLDVVAHSSDAPRLTLHVDNDLQNADRIPAENDITSIT